MAEPVAPRKTRPRSPTLNAAHEVIRARELRGGKGDPPQEDAGADSDLVIIPEPSTGSTPAEPAPPAGSVPTLCPAWKRGHCTGEGWCPKQHPQPSPNDGALPAVGHAAARAALCYGVAQGWILDETARGSVNIQKAVDRVTHTGQAEVASHTRGCHGGPAEWIILEPLGMVLVLAADMVRGVLHASCARRARPQWTIQVYTPPRAWPFSTWAELAVMWHLAPEDAPAGTAEEIARDLHTWPASRDFPWRRPRGGLPVAPAAEVFSLAATLQRHPDKRARHFLQTGTVPAAPPDSEWRWDAGRAQPLPGPWVLPLWYLPVGTLAHATQAVKGGFPAETPPRRGPAPQPTGGGGLGTVEASRRAPEPVFPPGPGPGATPRRGHGECGMGGNCAKHGVQVDRCGRPATHAIATGVPPPPTGGPLLGPPTGPYKGRMEGNAWPHQGVADEPGCTVPAGAGARTAHGPHTRGPPRPAQGVGPHGAAHRRGARPGAGAAAGALPAGPHPAPGHVQPPGPPGFAAPRQGRASGGVVEQWLTLRNPSTAQGHWYLHQLLFLPRAAPEHRRQNPYHTQPERRAAQSFPQPAPPALSPGQGPEALQQGPPLDTVTTVQQRGSNDADGAEPDCTNCRLVAWTAASRHLARDTTGLRQ